jgi:hypothetical protein
MCNYDCTLMTLPTTAMDRNRGPGYADIDTSIFKNMFTGERISARFQAEAFNTFNRVNFGNPANANTAPVATVSSGTYGPDHTSDNSPRVFQFGLKLLF